MDDDDWGGRWNGWRYGATRPPRLVLEARAKARKAKEAKEAKARKAKEAKEAKVRKAKETPGASP